MIWKELYTGILLTTCSIPTVDNKIPEVQQDAPAIK
jgi:hypothetical protein